MFQSSSVVRLGKAAETLALLALVIIYQSDLDHRTHHLNLCNKEIPAGTQHNQHWWPSRSSELCCACWILSIVTTPDCKNVFEAYVRIFVYVSRLQPNLFCSIDPYRNFA